MIKDIEKNQKPCSGNSPENERSVLEKVDHQQEQKRKSKNSSSLILVNNQVLLPIPYSGMLKNHLTFALFKKEASFKYLVKKKEEKSLRRNLKFNFKPLSLGT